MATTTTYAIATNIIAPKLQYGLRTMDTLNEYVGENERISYLGLQPIVITTLHPFGR